MLLPAAFCAQVQEPVDLVLLNGNIVTLDPSLPAAEALAIRGDRIVSLGRTENVRRMATDTTTVLDLAGKTAVPGLIESHAHFSGVGELKLQLDLSKTTSWEEIVALVEEAASGRKPGDWIIGRGWHQDKWQRPPVPSWEGLPYHHALSKASPQNPVLLIHASGHSCLANAEAIRLSGIEPGTPNPEGGTIVRDSQGELIGVFRENAQGLVRRAQQETRAARSPAENESEWHQIVSLAEAECLSKGITSFHDAGASFEFIELLKERASAGDLRIRLYVMLGESNQNLAGRLTESRLVGYGNHHLTVRAIKRSMDGALGTHGAWLLEPYEDLPSTSGLNTEELESLESTARLAAENDFQLCIHAIGDRANREVLDLYEQVYRSYPEKTDRRWRIEHAQHLHPDDIPRFAGIGVIPAMQAIHATSDGPWVPRRLGDQRAREGAYPWRSLLDAGSIICNGSDAPVENLDPLASIYSAVTRRMADGEPFFPEQAMTREEALRSYTSWAAYAAFEEDLKGTLVPGKLADITVLSGDLLTVPEGEIPGIEVTHTIVGGKILYSKPQ